jgi:hypothetical protein
MAEGKNCKRTTNKYSENYCSPSFPEHGSLYEHVLSASMESPNRNISDNGTQQHECGLEDDIHGSYEDIEDTQYNHFSVYDKRS